MNKFITYNLSKSVLIGSLILVLMISTVSIAMAQQTVKIGIVDVRKVYDNWTVKIEADKQFEPERAKVNEQKAAFQKADVELTKKKTILSPEQLQAEEKKLKKMAEDLDKSLKAIFEKIDAKADELSKQLDNLMDRSFSELAKKEGYTVILDSRSVRYSVSATDITDKISKLVNEFSSK